MNRDEATEVLSRYEIRTGSDGKTGLYLKRYNVRVATFHGNCAHLQDALRTLLEPTT